MKKLKKSQTRFIIKEFAEDLRKAKIGTGDNAVIDFRNDVPSDNKRPVYKVSTELLRFRKDNGRIASDVMTYENSKGELIEATDYSQGVLRMFLERKDPEKTSALKKSILKDGQREVAVATADGFLINGNRRKMVLESLQKDNPGEDRFKFLKVVILPGPEDSEEEPTVGEIEKIENKYQFQVLGKAEYYNFDKALSIKRKIELGISLSEQLEDDPNFTGLTEKRFLRKLQKVKDEYLEPLNAIDRYLTLFHRPGHYNTISEGRTDAKGRWQAFRDYHNSIYKRLQNASERKSLGLKKQDISTMEGIAFKIIRLRDLGDLRKKVHVVMRDLLKIAQNKKAREKLFYLKGEKDFELKKWESVDELGNPLDERTKDVIWSKKYGDEIISRLVNAYEIYEAKKRVESPVKALEAAFAKIEGPAFSRSSINRGNIRRVRSLIKRIKDRLDEIERQLSRK